MFCKLTVCISVIFNSPNKGSFSPNALSLLIDGGLLYYTSPIFPIIETKSILLSRKIRQNKKVVRGSVRENLIISIIMIVSF
jgi:hypothetical protein